MTTPLVVNVTDVPASDSARPRWNSGGVERRTIPRLAEIRRGLLVERRRRVEPGLTCSSSIPGATLCQRDSAGILLLTALTTLTTLTLILATVLATLLDPMNGLTSLRVTLQAALILTEITSPLHDLPASGDCSNASRIRLFLPHLTGDEVASQAAKGSRDDRSRGLGAEVVANRRAERSHKDIFHSLSRSLISLSMEDYPQNPFTLVVVRVLVFTFCPVGATCMGAAMMTG
jgi:hypothetical protein